MGLGQQLMSEALTMAKIAGLAIHFIEKFAIVDIEFSPRSVTCALCSPPRESSAQQGITRDSFESRFCRSADQQEWSKLCG